MAGEWARETEFMNMLSGAAKKPSRNAVQVLVDIAVEDETQAYKHVSALLIRSLKRSPPDRRINTFYVLSAICRQSKMQLKAADKYVPRLLPQMPAIAEMLAEIPKDQHDAIKRVLKSWRAEHVFTDGALGEIESALGVVEEEMAAEAEALAQASAPAGLVLPAAVELSDPTHPESPKPEPAPASFMRIPEAAAAPQQLVIEHALPPYSSAPVPLMTSAPAPASQWGAYNRQLESSAPVQAPSWDTHSRPPLLSVPQANGWAPGSELAASVPGLEPESAPVSHSAGASSRKRSRWSDAAAEQPAPAALSKAELTAPAASTGRPPAPAQSSDRTQNGHAGMPWEGSAASAQYGALPPPPPMHQQQNGGPAAGQGNGTGEVQLQPPAAAASQVADRPSADRPARRSRWEMPAATPPASGAIAAEQPQPAGEARSPPVQPHAASGFASRSALQAAPSDRPSTSTSQPVWTGEGVAPWLVAQEAAAEARRAAQGGGAGQPAAQQQGQIQHANVPPGLRLAAPQASMPGLAWPQPQRPQRPQAASSVPVQGAPPSQQQHQPDRPPALGVPRPGPPPPSHGGPMPGHPMAALRPQHHQQMQQHMQQQQHHQHLQQMHIQQQQQYQHMQQQQHYGMPPPMAFHPGPEGGHPQPGLMRPGFFPRPGPFPPGFRPPSGPAVLGPKPPAPPPERVDPSGPPLGAPPPPPGDPPAAPPGDPPSVSAAQPASAPPSAEAAALQELYADIAAIG